MNCVVTAGPTYESLDEVRRLTNFSTGRLGTELAAFLTARGHDVTLLIGQLATYRGERQARRMETFTTTGDLRERLRNLAAEAPDALFHAAAVSDFGFGKIWRRADGGELSEIKSGKISTGAGTLLAELVPTPKIIAELRGWYPKARLVGWKFEMEGTRDDVIALAKRQIKECHTDASIANGRAYGEGFGFVTATTDSVHLADMQALFPSLEKFLQGG